VYRATFLFVAVGMERRRSTRTTRPDSVVYTSTSPSSSSRTGGVGGGGAAGRVGLDGRRDDRAGLSSAASAGAASSASAALVGGSGRGGLADEPSGRSGRTSFSAACDASAGTVINVPQFEHRQTPPANPRSSSSSSWHPGHSSSIVCCLPRDAGRLGRLAMNGCSGVG
jgi:hypothetical protein